MITINGEARDFHGQSIGEIISDLGLDPARPGVAVAINGVIACRADWPTASLADEDRIEVVQAKAGG